MTAPNTDIGHPARIALNVDQIGRGTIIVNGIDLSNIVSSARLYSRIGNITAVELEIPAASITVDMEVALRIYIVNGEPASEEPV